MTFMTIAQFLERRPMGRSTLYRFVKNGDIRLTKLGRASRITEAEAERFDASLPTKGGNDEKA